MRFGGHGVAPARLWWTVPLGLAILSAVVFVSVVLPALASGPSVPAQLVVPVASSSAGPTATTSPPASPKKTATPRPTATHVTPRLTPSTTVVVPRQPVVRESDDRTEHRDPSPSGESGDR